MEVFKNFNAQNNLQAILYLMGAEIFSFHQSFMPYECWVAMPKNEHELRTINVCFQIMILFAPFLHQSVTFSGFHWLLEGGFERKLPKKVHTGSENSESQKKWWIGVKMGQKYDLEPNFDRP